MTVGRSGFPTTVELDDFQWLQTDTTLLSPTDGDAGQPLKTLYFEELTTLPTYQQLIELQKKLTAKRLEIRNQQALLKTMTDSKLYSEEALTRFMGERWSPDAITAKQKEIAGHIQSVKSIIETLKTEVLANLKTQQQAQKTREDQVAKKEEQIREFKTSLVNAMSQAASDYYNAKRAEILEKAKSNPSACQEALNKLLTDFPKLFGSVSRVELKDSDSIYRLFPNKQGFFDKIVSPSKVDISRPIGQSLSLNDQDGYGKVVSDDELKASPVYVGDSTVRLTRNIKEHLIENRNLLELQQLFSAVKQKCNGDSYAEKAMTTHSKKLPKHNGLPIDLLQVTEASIIAREAVSISPAKAHDALEKAGQSLGKIKSVASTTLLQADEVLLKAAKFVTFQSVAKEAHKQLANSLEEKEVAVSNAIGGMALFIENSEQKISEKSQQSVDSIILYASEGGGAGIQKTLARYETLAKTAAALIEQAQAVVKAGAADSAEVGSLSSLEERVGKLQTNIQYRKRIAGLAAQYKIIELVHITEVGSVAQKVEEQKQELLSYADVAKNYAAFNLGAKNILASSNEVISSANSIAEKMNGIKDIHSLDLEKMIAEGETSQREAENKLTSIATQVKILAESKKTAEASFEAAKTQYGEAVAAKYQAMVTIANQRYEEALAAHNQAQKAHDDANQTLKKAQTYLQWISTYKQAILDSQALTKTYRSLQQECIALTQTPLQGQGFKSLADAQAKALAIADALKKVNLSLEEANQSLFVLNSTKTGLNESLEAIKASGAHISSLDVACTKAFSQLQAELGKTQTSLESIKTCYIALDQAKMPVQLQANFHRQQKLHCLALLLAKNAEQCQAELRFGGGRQIIVDGKSYKVQATIAKMMTVLFDKQKKEDRKWQELKKIIKTRQELASGKKTSTSTGKTSKVQEFFTWVNRSLFFANRVKGGNVDRLCEQLDTLLSQEKADADHSGFEKRIHSIFSSDRKQAKSTPVHLRADNRILFGHR